ncbi:hypothetical protein HOLleu_00576 [Holothuria leucospilota]|uniref:Ig-like domain-containing protein n=1 Tax=Holothuria leucospilota TaxID=206669 RepID=A0A9Q1HIS5_HOLLE|nr:hypothetical protein HOLleu_00576 [Holothuria leucospilota]
MINNNTVSESSKISVQVLPNYGDNLTFDVISTLKIQLFDKDGILACIGSDQTLSGSQQQNVKFTLYATPSMVLTINGYSSAKEVYVDKREEIYAVCSAVGARPDVNLTWLINDKPTNLHFDENSHRRTEVGVYDLIATLQFNLSENEDFGTITCISNFEVINVTSVVHGTFCTYVLPIVTVSVNGDTTAHVKDVVEDDLVNVTCIATGARPAVDVSWLINGRKFNGPGSSLKTTVEHINETFQTESTIKFIPRDKEGNITCVISSLHANKTYHYAFFRLKDRPDEHSFGLIITLSSTGCILVVLLIPLLCVILKRSRASRRRQLRYSRSM